MASRQHNSRGDSSTAVSISSPCGDEKEIDEDKKDLEKSVPPPGGETRSSNDALPIAVIDWDGPNDPDNPQTWSAWKKTYHVLVPAILGFVVSVPLHLKDLIDTD
jgi:hypothetical protein